MRCPFCRHDIRVSGRFCPRCGRQIFGLPVGQTTPPPGPGVPASPFGLRAGATSPEPPEQPAAADNVGKTCPYDQFPIAVGQPIIVCPACGVPHHADCWRENGGCTTYGCARSPSSSPVARAAGTQPVPPAPPYPPYARSRRQSVVNGNQAVTAVLAAEVDRNAGNALLYALLGLACCPIVSIVGFFMALGVFASLSRNGLHCPAASGKATWAAAIGAAAPVLWTIGLVVLGQGGATGY